METERNQILREFRTELAELQKEFHARTQGLLLRIAAELGELEPGPSRIDFVSPYAKKRQTVKCGKL